MGSVKPVSARRPRGRPRTPPPFPRPEAALAGPEPPSSGVRDDLRLWQRLIVYYRANGCRSGAAMAERQAERIIERRARECLSRRDR